jgi:preprotein translocase subunit SecG
MEIGRELTIGELQILLVIMVAILAIVGTILLERKKEE